MTTIEKIHNEIDTAQDRLIIEANKIIENTSINLNNKEELILNKAERLKRFGFNNEEIEKANKIQNKINKNKEIIVKNKKQAELIKYYTMKYPFHKFLTLDEFENICKKYKLIYASVQNYKKSIPEKNLQDIENSKKLENSDCENKYTKITYKIYNWSLFKNNYVLPNEAKNWENPIVIDRDINNDSKVKNILKNLYNPSKEIAFNKVEYEKIDKSGYFIAAPKSHFNLKNLTQKGLGFFNIKIFETKDPIVFQFCKGDMIRIETKWGLEAEDEKLVLPINN